MAGAMEDPKFMYMAAATVLAIILAYIFFARGKSGSSGLKKEDTLKKQERALLRKKQPTAAAEDEGGGEDEQEQDAAPATSKLEDASAWADGEVGLSLISSVAYEDPFTVDPPSVTFKIGTESNQIKQLVTVTNNTPERAVFKVRTNNPRRYLVKPSMTFVGKNSSATIEIKIKEREVDAIAADMKAKNVKEATVQDKFLLQWMTLDKKFYYNDSFFELIKEATWIQKAQRLIKSVPKELQKKKFRFSKLKVKFCI